VTANIFIQKRPRQSATLVHVKPTSGLARAARWMAMNGAMSAKPYFFVGGAGRRYSSVISFTR
jgi:hypothetical protein